jgi:hypothetical protein
MDRTLADELWTRGASHALSAQALAEFARQEAVSAGAADVEQHAFNGKFSASIHLLIGFSFELLLKSAYILHGGDANALNRNIRHDLLVALEEAEKAGFISSVQNLRWVVECIREPHIEHQFRYGGAEIIEMPGLELSLPTLDGLVRELGMLIHE